MRFHELDALRAVAMLLGIVLHCLLFLIHDLFNQWPVQEAWADSVALNVNPYAHGYLLIHGFRMPLFFLLSGFFTAMLWQRRGLRPLVVHRLKRIALPLALGALTIVPVCVWLWTGLEPETFGTFDPAFWPIASLVGVFEVAGVDLGFFDFGFYHLWFLWHLLLLVGIFAILVKLGAQFTSPAWWTLIPLVAAVMYLMKEPTVGPDTSAGLLIDVVTRTDGEVVLAFPTVLAFYALFFLFGAFYYQRGMTAPRWWTVGVGAALVVAYPGALFYIQSEPQSADWAGTSAFQAAYAWLMCFGMMGLFTWIAAKGRAWVRYMSDSSYWLYLWHLPLVVIGQWVLVDAPISPHLKFALIFTVVTALLLATYHLGVRYTWVGTMLNGRRTRAA